MQVLLFVKWSVVRRLAYFGGGSDERNRVVVMQVSMYRYICNML